MLIHLHSQATTTPGVRAAIQASDDAGTVFAERFGVTPQTVCKWRKRDSVEDRSQRAALQRPHRGCAAKPPLPIRRGPGDHPAPLCLALQPAAPSISLGQQGTLAGNEGLTQTQAADVQEKASYLPGCNKTNHPPHLDRRPRPHRRPPPGASASTSDERKPSSAPSQTPNNSTATDRPGIVASRASDDKPSSPPPPRTSRKSQWQPAKTTQCRRQTRAPPANPRQAKTNPAKMTGFVRSLSPRNGDPS